MLVIRATHFKFRWVFLGVVETIVGSLLFCGVGFNCSVSFIAHEQALWGTLAVSFLSAVIHYLVITPGPSAMLRSYQLQR